MQKLMYFGTRERMTWVRVPAIETPLTKGGWGAEGVYLNGGAYVRRSATGHKRYEFSWGMTDQENIYDIIDYADGLYGAGLIYFHEPFAMVSNILPQFWAAPRLAAEDAPPFVLGKRPTLVATAANAFGYPTQSAVYTLTALDTFSTLWIPIPNGYTLHVGVHGSATGTAAVTVLPDGGSVANLTLLNVLTNTLTNYTSTASGVTLSFGGVGQLTLAGLIAQVLPTGDSPSTGDFISGRGHSGCRFAPNSITVSGFSAPNALDKVSATAGLIETGAWEEV